MKSKERFNTSDDALTAPTAKVIVQAPEGKTLEDSDVSADVDKLVTSLKDSGKLKDTDELVNPVMAAMGMKQQLTEQKAAQGIPQEQIEADLKAISPLSEDRRTGTIDITFDAEKAADVTSEQRDAITTIIPMTAVTSPPPTPATPSKTANPWECRVNSSASPSPR